MKESKRLLIIILLFLVAWFLPVQNDRFMGAIQESLTLLNWYAREHVLLCLIPAFFIAGAISVFVSQGSVLKYLGPKANKLVAYTVASLSGTILAVCSCTILPLFASIHKRGAGLGPATAFLYAGPAINILAIILTARILGPELGIARAVGAIGFSVIIGLLMHLIYRKEEKKREIKAAAAISVTEEDDNKPLWQTGIYFTSMIGILVFANWSAPVIGGGSDNVSMWASIFSSKWVVTGLFIIILAFSLKSWFTRPELKEWVESSWGYAKQIFPLLLIGVLIAGFLLGGPCKGDRGMIPNSWISSMVGDNTIWSNLFASVAGVFMYFATLTEVPIVEGLLNSGMANGPALALLLAGPALSLPSILVIRSVMGTGKTISFLLLVIGLSTVAGYTYGIIMPG